MGLLLIVISITSCGKNIFCGEYAKYASGDFVMNDCFVVFPDNVDAEFLNMSVLVAVISHNRI